MERKKRNNRIKLEEHIIALSESKDFNLAKKEWEHLESIWDNSGNVSCPCGQSIKEVCYIQNKINNIKTYVGNVCVNRFMDIDTDKKLFARLKIITLDPSKTPNQSLFDYALEKGYLYNGNEEIFYRKIIGKRSLSLKQINWLKLINQRILNKNIVRK